MKIEACQNLNMSRGCCKPGPKGRVGKPIKIGNVHEPDYSRSYKQLAYVIGISMLGFASLFLATKKPKMINYRA